MRDDFEEHYLNRKERKTERKMASRLDRSKYKKTDQDKIIKQKVSREGLLRGIVITVQSYGIVVESDEKRFLCRLRGALKKEISRVKNLVIVGDFVWFEDVGANEGSIVEVEERKSALSRAESLTQQREHFIAANVDQVLITVSVVNPLLRPTIIDRYLIAAAKGNLIPIIVCNKIDLLQDETIPQVIRQEQQELLAACRNMYERLDILFLMTSSETKEGIQELQRFMHNKISLFSGQSGTGKSSLINATCQHDLPIAETVHRTKKGAHTTTFAQLLPVPDGGWCVDTPGIKSFGVWNITKYELQGFFPEIQQAATACRFPDCMHKGEADCALLQAVEEGRVSPLRYISYLNILESIESEHLRR